MDRQPPIKFFIGTSHNGCSENAMVLEYSIKKHCSVPYEIVWMCLDLKHKESFWHGWDTSTWSTPFSGFRYGIAEYCNYKGFAIYQDDDQIWLSDPKELWNLDLEGHIMSGKLLGNGELRHCVSLIDCAKFGELGVPVNRRKNTPLFNHVMKELTFPRTQIMDDNFNNYDGENEEIERIKLLHYTDMRTNPGVKLAVKRLGGQQNHWFDGKLENHRRPEIEQIFYKYYDEAIAAGFKVEDYVRSNEVIKYNKQSQKDYKANNGFDVSEGQ